MDREQRRRELLDYFTRMGIDTSCAICGSEDWDIGRTGEEFEVSEGRKVLPVELLCNFCGRMVTYNAYTIGSGK
jgi:hypothetical protein